MGKGSEPLIVIALENTLRKQLELVQGLVISA